jgi:hypothetical protein
MQDLTGKVNNGGSTAAGQLSASEWNQLPDEVQNVITSLGLTLSNADVNQLGKAIAGYVANGTFYTDSGSANTYVLTTIGSKQSAATLTDGFKVDFIATNNNTGASTVNVAGLGVKSIKTKEGSDPSAAQITGRISLVYDLSNNRFEFTPESSNANSQYLGTPVGGTIALPTHLSGIVEPPKNNASFRYILLTAGESGTGEYNETILTSETVSGSAPLLVATAVINLAASPINGLTVNLLNSEGRFIKPGISSGTVANDQMQKITGGVVSANPPFRNAVYSGAFIQNGVGFRYVGNDSGGSNLGFDSSFSPDARTGTFTDVKNIQNTYYMRIA